MKELKNIVVGICNDHAGYELKQTIIETLKSEIEKFNDYGCFSTESCDYPDYAHKLASAVESGECDLGIAICGTGNGISMTCNKHQGIRAALCWDKPIAELARQHNDANVLGLPARFISTEKALEIVRAFLTTDFEGGRHQRRVEKIRLA